MFRRTLPGVSILTVCLCSIGLQLPTHVGSGAFFGVFGAEVLPVLDPDCNGIAPKKSSCKELHTACDKIEYTSGPQSAALGGVNNLRFEPTGNSVECTTNQNYKTLCPNKPIWAEKTGVKCIEIKVETLE